MKTKVEIKLVSFGLFLFGIGVALLSLSCGKAQSSTKRAEIIPSPTSGVTCYAIIDDNEKVVGGNCLRDQ